MDWDRCSRFKFVHSDLAHIKSERKKTENRNVEQISFVSSLVFHALHTGGEQTLTLLDQSNISLCPKNFGYISVVKDIPWLISVLLVVKFVNCQQS